MEGSASANEHGRVAAAPPTGWHIYLNDPEDVAGCVALALHLGSLAGDPTRAELKEVLTSSAIFNPDAAFAYRAAAERLVDRDRRERGRVEDQLDRSTDPLFLLLKSEFQAQSSAVNDEVSEVMLEIERIKSSLSLRTQILNAAISGALVSMFVVFTPLIPSVISSGFGYIIHLLSGGKS